MTNQISTKLQGRSRMNQSAIMAFIVFCCVLLASTAATQYLASAFKYHPALSGKITGNLYWPWSWIVWFLEFKGKYDETFKEGLTIFTFSTALLFLPFTMYVLNQKRQRDLSAIEGLHGTAHWADRQEIVESGLLPQPQTHSQGVYVGAWLDEKNRKTRYLRHNGPEHVLAFAPTRSGKGVGLVIPTLLSWPHSTVVYDIKGENWALTAGWRKEYAGNKVLNFDPTAEGSARFNPLSEIRLETPQEVADAQNISTMLVDPDGKGLVDHWSKMSQALLTGAILHCCYVQHRDTGQSATLADVDSLLASPEMDIQAVLELMLEHKHLGDQPHPVVARVARNMLNLSEKELSSVVSSALSFLSLYRDPLVATNTGRSDFRVRDLMHGENPVSLYLVVRPSDADRLRPLIRLVITQIVRLSTEKMRFEGGKSVADYRHRLLLLIDEFASLKRLTVIEEALAFMAGYGIKAYLIVQDLQQIYSAYGREEGLIGNCHIRIAYAPNKIETAELLSRMAGQTTVVRKQTTISGLRTGSRGQRSESMQEVQRPLITPDEVMRLPSASKDRQGNVLEPGHMLVFVAGQAPIYGRQILYFRDPVFQKRAMIEAPAMSDRISAKTVDENQDQEVGT